MIEVERERERERERVGFLRLFEKVVHLIRIINFLGSGIDWSDEGRSFRRELRENSHRRSKEISKKKKK